MALVAAAAALMASVATLVVALVASDRRATSDAERDALRSAQAVLEEVATESDPAALASVLAEEVSELVPRRFSVAVYDRGVRVAGADALPDRMPTRAGCRFARGPEGEWLVCVAVHERGVRSVVAAIPRGEVLAHRRPLFFGGLVALLVVGLLAVFGGVVVARISLRPLVRLRHALEAFQTGREASREPPALPRSELAELDIVVEALQGLLEELDSEVQRARRFSADAAHELRTPLTKIRADLELLGEALGDDSPQRARANGLVARVSDLGLLVERLLVLASPTTSLRTDNLVSLAATVESELEGVTETGRVRMRLEDDGLVRGDATLLASVVSNALGNALKFSDGVVDVRVFATGDEIVLRVDDQGPGLSPEVRAQAFEGFFRAPEHRSRPGHGIGLALIAHVIAAHAGVCAFIGEAPGAHLEIRLPKHVTA